MAVDDYGRYVPGTELIKLSYGFMLTVMIIVAAGCGLYKFDIIKGRKILPLVQITSAMFLLLTMMIVPPGMSPGGSFELSTV